MHVRMIVNVGKITTAQIIHSMIYFWVTHFEPSTCYRRPSTKFQTQPTLFNTDSMLPCLCSRKAGLHLNAVFTRLKIGLMEISRSRFKQYKNPMLKTQINVLGCFVNFLVIFRYIWEIVFLKRVVKFGEIRNS